MLSHFSCILLFVAPWTAAHQAPLSMGFSRQEYWNGSPCPPPGDIPHPGIEPMTPVSPALQVDSLPLSHPEAPKNGHALEQIPVLLRLWLREACGKHGLYVNTSVNPEEQHWGHQSVILPAEGNLSAAFSWPQMSTCYKWGHKVGRQWSEDKVLCIQSSKFIR